MTQLAWDYDEPVSSTEDFVAGSDLTDEQLADYQAIYHERFRKRSVSPSTDLLVKRLEELAGTVGLSWQAPERPRMRADALDYVELLVPKLQEYADKLRDAA